MKKVILLATVLAASALTFTSCSDDDDSKGAASIRFDQGSSVTMTEEGTLLVTGEITAPDGAEIQSINVVCLYGTTQSSEAKIADMKDLTKVNSGKYTFRFTETSPGIRDHITDIKGIKISATVKDGDPTARTIDVLHGTTPPEETPLSNPTSFTWVRTANEQTVYDPVGLKFAASNVSKALYAQIVKNTAIKMVDLSSAFGNITTKEDLKDKVDNGTDLSVIKKLQVDSDISKDYQIAIGTKVGNTYYLVKITHANIETIPVGTNNSTVCTAYTRVFYGLQIVVAFFIYVF